MQGQSGESAILDTSFIIDKAPPLFEPAVIIPLHPAGFALVSPEDYALVEPFKWRMVRIKKKYIYAATITKEKGTTATILMHRLILNLTNGLDGDHINDNGLDNRRSNLRPATRSQNQQWQRIRINKKSKYKGVCQFKNNWRAQIRIDGKKTWLGDYRTEIEAAMAYDKACIKHFGEFARPNGVLNT